MSASEQSEGEPVPSPAGRGWRAAAYIVVFVVLLVAWELGWGLVMMLLDGGPLSRYPKSRLWPVPIIGIPLVAFLAFMYRHRQRDEPSQPPGL